MFRMRMRVPHLSSRGQPSAAGVQAKSVVWIREQRNQRARRTDADCCALAAVSPHAPSHRRRLSPRREQSILHIPRACASALGFQHRLISHPQHRQLLRMLAHLRFIVAHSIHARHFVLTIAVISP